MTSLGIKQGRYEEDFRHCFFVFLFKIVNLTYTRRVCAYLFYGGRKDI